MKPAIILLSGGIDSATCCAIARDKGYTVFAMSFSYGQRHSIELDSARNVAAYFEAAEHRIVRIDLRAFGGSSLTSDTAVPKNRALDKPQNDVIPNTYVPARNTIFLSFAVGWAEVLSCYDIFVGVNSIDYSGYPDCRPEYIEAYERMANLATKAGVEGNRLRIHTPLITLTKAEIIRTGIGLGLDYGITHSCYDPVGELACGQCDSCILRRRGFEEAQVSDPTRYVKSA